MGSQSKEEEITQRVCKEQREWWCFSESRKMLQQEKESMKSVKQPNVWSNQPNSFLRYSFPCIHCYSFVAKKSIEAEVHKNSSEDDDH